ncbi:MAG: hypothetical protein LRY50_09270, partial [Geovibrio sp.]|nr:hypothetical protein [Geovibrio sp.]
DDTDSDSGSDSDNTDDANMVLKHKVTDKSYDDINYVCDCVDTCQFESWNWCYCRQTHFDRIIEQIEDENTDRYENMQDKQKDSCSG